MMPVVIQFHSDNPIEYQGTKRGTILVFVAGKTEINLVTTLITTLQNRGHTANLYPCGFHADLPMKDKEMLTKYPIEDKNDKGPMTASAQGENWENEGVKQRLETKPDYKKWSQRTVIVATNAAETGVTFENCMYVVDTCFMGLLSPYGRSSRSLPSHMGRRPATRGIRNMQEALSRSRGHRPVCSRQKVGLSGPYFQD